MVSFKHCGTLRPAKEVFWLKSDLPRYDYQILYKAVCPVCKRAKLADYFYVWRGFTYEKGLYPTNKIRAVDLDGWLSRIHTDLERRELPMYENGRDTRALPMVSDATFEMSRDPEQVHAKILRRFALAYKPPTLQAPPSTAI